MENFLNLENLRTNQETDQQDLPIKAPRPEFKNHQEDSNTLYISSFFSRFYKQSKSN